MTRAKQKITKAGIPYRIPADDELGDRLSEVLAVIYLLFNEGYLSSTGERAQSRDLVENAEWLTSLLAGLMPREPEIIGLLALIRLHRARAAARFDDRGQLVLLRDQDRSLWDHSAIAEAIRLLTRAAGHRRPGPYQLQAAIVACHAEAHRWEDTDWPQSTSCSGHAAPTARSDTHETLGAAPTGKQLVELGRVVLQWTRSRRAHHPSHQHPTRLSNDTTSTSLPS